MGSNTTGSASGSGTSGRRGRRIEPQVGEAVEQRVERHGRRQPRECSPTQRCAPIANATLVFLRPEDIEHVGIGEPRLVAISPRRGSRPPAPRRRRSGDGSRESPAVRPEPVRSRRRCAPSPLRFRTRRELDGAPATAESRESRARRIADHCMTFIDCSWHSVESIACREIQSSTGRGATSFSLAGWCVEPRPTSHCQP
jgi:hypothetical protein